MSGGCVGVGSGCVGAGSGCGEEGGGLVTSLFIMSSLLDVVTLRTNCRQRKVSSIKTISR